MTQPEFVQAIREQASWCARLDSPLYAALLTHIAGDVEAGGPTWAYLRDYAAEPWRALVPLRSQLASAQTVEIVTAPSAAPNPQWLEFVVTGKARTAIRHFLKRLQHEDAVDIGHRMLDRALDTRGSSLDAIPTEVLDRFLHEARLKRLEELLAEIALGNRMPDVVARHLLALRDGQSDDAAPGAGMAHDKIRITGAERGVLSFANCCHPLPGDAIFGYLSPGKGIVVHREECPNVAELRKSPERCVAIEWDRDVQGDYRAELRIEVINRPGVLATIAAAIAAADSNIENVEYVERDLAAAALLFAIEVKNRKHLAEVIRRVRRTGVVSGVYRYPL
mgnify:CR=1 FL=1